MANEQVSGVSGGKAKLTRREKIIAIKPLVQILQNQIELLRQATAQSNCPDPNDPCSCYPGWTQMLAAMEGFVCVNERMGKRLTLSDLKMHWEGLSPLEREIETALANTSEERAPFDNIYSVEDILLWFNDTDNQQLIIEQADMFGIDPILLSGILASEMYYDYDKTAELKNWLFYTQWANGLRVGDSRMEDLLREEDGRGSYGAMGFAKTHITDSLIPAYWYLLNQPGVSVDNHPWNQNLGAAYLPTPGENLEEISYIDIALYLSIPDANAGLSGGVLSSRPDNPKFSTGNVAAAAMVARWYQDQYLADQRNPCNLSNADRAAIWAGYRSGVGPGLGFSDMDEFQKLALEAHNQTLSLPWMEFFSKELFSDVECE